MVTVSRPGQAIVAASDRNGLAAWAERTGRRGTSGPAAGGLRFAFYGRASTEDWQDPATSPGRPRDQAATLVDGYGRLRAEVFAIARIPVAARARRPHT